jgi:hypothetical protein
VNNFYFFLQYQSEVVDFDNYDCAVVSRSSVAVSVLLFHLHYSMPLGRDPEFRGFQVGVRNSGKFRNWNSMEFQSHI